MGDAFDEELERLAPAWADGYLGVSPLLSHHEVPSEESARRLLGAHATVRLSLVAEPPRSVTLQPAQGALRPLPEAQRVEQTAELLRQTARYGGGALEAAAAQRLATAFFSQFERPLVLANSLRVGWTSWRAVTQEGQDMLVVAMDARRFRFLLGIVGD